MSPYGDSEVVHSQVRSSSANSNVFMYACTYVRTNICLYVGERQGDRETESQRDRETERQRDRETERQRDRETERQRDRETERQRDRETERQRGRETERQNVVSKRRSVVSSSVFVYFYGVEGAKCCK